MIAAIQGILEAQGPDWAVVQVGGFSIRLFVPSSTAQRFPAIGQSLRLLTYLYVREDALTLYGFATPDEQSLFEQLIGVSGVGPRLALAMLSAASAESLRAAIASEKIEGLTRIPGIGKKLAGRLILELRGKLIAPSGETTPTPAPADVDLIEALIGLGYTVTDAQAALKSVPADLDLEERLRRALQYFARVVSAP